MKKKERARKNRANNKGGYKVKPLAVKREAVSLISSGELTPDMAAEKYGVSTSTIRNWQLKLMCEDIPPHPHEADLDMRRIAQDTLDGLLTVEEAVSKYNLSTPARLLRWKSKVRKENWDARRAGILPGRKPLPPVTADESEQVAAMRKALEDAQLRVLALETLIEVAEEELGVDIRKKPGTKQSK